MLSFACLSYHLNAPLSLAESGLLHPIQPGLIHFPIGSGADFAGITIEYSNGVDASVDFTDLLAVIGGAGGVQKVVQFQAIYAAVLQIIRTAETVTGTVAVASTALKWAAHTITPGTASVLAVNPIGRALHTLVYAGAPVPLTAGTHLSLDFSDCVGFKASLNLYGSYSD